MGVPDFYTFLNSLTPEEKHKWNIAIADCPRIKFPFFLTRKNQSAIRQQYISFGLEMLRSYHEWLLQEMEKNN